MGYNFVSERKRRRITDIKPSLWTIISISICISIIISIAVTIGKFGIGRRYWASLAPSNDSKSKLPDFDWNYPRIIDDPDVVCKQYDLPTYHPGMMKYIERSGPVKCWEWGVAQMKGDTVHIKNSATSAVRCNFTEVYRQDDFDYIFLKTVWSEGPYKLQYSDAVKVECMDFNSGKSWEEVYAGARRIDTVVRHTGWYRTPKEGLPLNILVWGFDSTSKNNFFRKMPKSWPYMRDKMNGILMDGFNVHQTSTFSQLCPILIGVTNFPGPTTVYVDDELPVATTFAYFRKRGYVTAFVEDEQNWGTFQHWGEGFREQPSDHSTRPYMMEKATRIGHKPPCCFGGSCNRAAETYVRDFWKTYSDKPKFAFTLQGTYSHDDPNKLDMIDRELYKFLHWLNHPSVKNNTLIVIMGDHGPRGHAMTFTRQGTLELKRPLMYIVYPEWMGKQWPVAIENLRINSKRLVTALDLHYTFKNILNFTMGDYKSVPTLQSLSTGLSMFKPMPKGRTCAMAEITSHYCACKNVKELDVRGEKKPLLRKLALKVIEALNLHVQDSLKECLTSNPMYKTFVDAMETEVDNVTGLLPNADSYHPFCREWKLDKVERAFAVIPGTQGNATTEADTADPTSTEYDLTIVASPGPSHFLTTSALDPDTEEPATVDVDYVTRMDWYSPNAKCIEQACPELEKYCYC